MGGGGGGVGKQEGSCYSGQQVTGSAGCQVRVRGWGAGWIMSFRNLWDDVLNVLSEASFKKELILKG